MLCIYMLQKHDQKNIVYFTGFLPLGFLREKKWHSLYLTQEMKNGTQIVMHFGCDSD